MEEFKDFFTPPVIWFLIGLVLLLLELALPGLIIIFFGVGAWITAICVKLFDININIQLLIFLVSSILCLVLLRKYLKKRFFGEDEKKDDILEDEFIGKIGTTETVLKPGVAGKITFKGTTWSAVSDTEIGAGEQVKIVDKASITLHVTKA
ncbi:MAG: NfeD family protein [Bacteroidales bacterium]|nr:NfeD family protein [Bacteroidales bacterium]